MPKNTLPLVKIIRKHSPGCWALKSCPDNPWAYFGSTSRKEPPISSEMYRDSIGRNNNGGYYRWITAGCNDSNCTGVIAVREKDLLRLAQEALDAK